MAIAYGRTRADAIAQLQRKRPLPQGGFAPRPAPAQAPGVGAPYQQQTNNPNAVQPQKLGGAALNTQNLQYAGMGGGAGVPGGYSPNGMNNQLQFSGGQPQYANIAAGGDQPKPMPQYQQQAAQPQSNQQGYGPQQAGYQPQNTGIGGQNNPSPWAPGGDPASGGFGMGSQSVRDQYAQSQMAGQNNPYANSQQMQLPNNPLVQGMFNGQNPFANFQVNQQGQGWSTDQYGNPRFDKPEDRWSQAPGALPYGPGMTGDENKFNFIQYLMQNGPSAQKFAQGMPNPADLYSGITPQAQQFLGGMPGNIANNPWQGQAGNLQNYGAGMLGQGGPPQAPNIQGAPTQYNAPQAPGFQQPQFDQMNVGQFNPDRVGGPNWSPQQGFNPDSVAGPNMPQVRQPNAQFGGPNAGVPGFQDILNMSQRLGGNAGNVPRENIQGSGFQNSQLFGNPNSIAQQGFQSALGAAQGQAGADLSQDIFKQQANALQKQLAAAGIRANTLGGEEVGSRGMVYTPGASGVSDEAFAKYYAPAQAEIGAKLADLAAGNLDRTIQQQQFGTGALTGLGSAASGAAQGNAGLLQGENQFLGGAGLQQRGQDIQQNQFNAGQGQSNLNALSNLAGTLGGLNVNAFQAGTGRGTAMGDLDLRAQQLAQQGALGGYEAQTGRAGTFGNLANQNQQLNQQGLLDAYRAQTERQGTQGNIFNQGQGNITDAYNAATQRGNVGANAYNDWMQNQLGFGNLGLGYNQLGAQNQNQYNQNLVDLYGTQGQIGNQYQQNQNQLLNNLMNNAQGWGGMYQQGQLGLGDLYAQMLGQQGGFQQGYNQQQLGANQFDTGNFWNLYQNFANMGRQAQAQREANRFHFGRDVLGGLLGGAGQVGSALLTGGASLPFTMPGQLGQTGPMSYYNPYQ